MKIINPISTIVYAINSIKSSIDKARADYIKRRNRPYMSCDFSEGITEEDLLEFAKKAVGYIKNREIDVSVCGPVVKGAVISQSRLSMWMFKIDYNDYGHITGTYWLSSENTDSKIPGVIAHYIQDAIVSKLSKQDDSVVPCNLENDMPRDDIYYCPNCGAILNDQDGFDPEQQCWVCKKCGKQLTGDNLNSDVFGDVVWYCDNCGAILNSQEGFSEEQGTWKCSKCGYENDVTQGNIIDSNGFS